jgi:hypothetical protein
MEQILRQIPTVVLSAEYLLGGLLRVSSWPFPNLHKRVLQKNTDIAPILYPIVPFQDVKIHSRWVGSWMIITGLLWASTSTRGSLMTLGLSLFWTSAGAYSQWKAGMPFWLPCVNFVLSLVVWSTAN